MKKLVIMLHGVGSNGEDLEPIAEYWQQRIPDLEFASPNAPFPFMNSPFAFQWFSLDGITSENRVKRIIDVRPHFDQVIEDILIKHDMVNQLDRVVLCGFSQGTMMALDALVSGRWHVAGVIGLSGRLASAIETSNTDAPILLMHGEADAVIPVQETRAAQQKLSDAGFKVQVETFAGLPHSVNQHELHIGEQFLKTIFN